MDQNFNTQEEIFFSSPMQPVKNAKYYRAVARQKLKPFWGIAILVTCLAMLLGAVGGLSFNFNFGEKETVQISEADAKLLADAILEMNWDAIADFLVKIAPGLAIFVSLFFLIVIFAAVFAIAFWLFVSSPVKVGYQRFQLELMDGRAPEIRVATLFRFFKEGYFKTVGLNALHGLIMFAVGIPAYIGVFLGAWYFLSAVIAATTLTAILIASLGFLGILMAGVAVSLVLELPINYMYTYAHMIMAEYPGVGVVDALRQSRTLMRGHKWKLFCLDISFIGWYLLAAVLTFGIGTIVVTPYNQAARAAFYHDIANRDAAQETEFPSIDPDDYVSEENQ